jgi:hypothetical protein
MSLKLVKAFRLTEEEHADAFERYANAFLVDDYSELNALGGKKDKGMDAYVYEGSGKVVLVVQSCVSPTTRARAKILDTISKLKGNMPELFVYCTSAPIGTELDDTKRELRQKHKVTLDVCDAAWFVQRHKTSVNRAALSEAYAQQTLEPFVRSLQPDRLYSLVLSEDQERVVVQYLEAVNLDRAKDSNLTKGIFDALIACVTRDADPYAKVYSEEAIVAAICAMFPGGHAARIKEIVPGRIKHLAQRKALHLNKPAGGYVLSFPYRDKVLGNIQRAQDRELAFVAALSSAVKATAEDREINYAFSNEAIVEAGHQCVLWYLSEQGKTIADPSSGLLNILNAEKLVEAYLGKHPLPKGKGKEKLTEEILLDLLPHALYVTLNSKDEEIAKYLRSKADLFIIHGFMQVTPDVQDACKKLLGGDVLYLDTTILVRCIAEHCSLSGRRPLLNTLEGARKLGYQLRTWRPYIGELVSHLKGRVLLEWANHFRGLSKDVLEASLRTAPTLINVFYKRVEAEGGSLDGIVEEIIGRSNEQENAIEFLKELFAIETEELPPQDAEDERERQRVYGAWLEGKIKHQNMEDDRFQLLVRNDVNAYIALLKLRRQNKPEGPNYGYKTWYLTLDRMPLRIAKVLSPNREPVYEVAISFSYLMNCVATLANVGVAHIPEELIPATTILDETEMVPSELRSVYQAEWKPGEKRFLRERRLRDLTHQIKAGAPLKIEVLPDEDI